MQIARWKMIRFDTINSPLFSLHPPYRIWSKGLNQNWGKPKPREKKREISPTSMEVRRKVAAPLRGFPLGAKSKGGKGGDGLGFGQEQRWGGHHTEGREEAAQEEHGSGEVSILLFL
jgi:hypothetical protein